MCEGVVAEEGSVSPSSASAAVSGASSSVSFVSVSFFAAEGVMGERGRSVNTSPPSSSVSSLSSGGLTRNRTEARSLGLALGVV